MSKSKNKHQKSPSLLGVKFSHPLVASALVLVALLAISNLQITQNIAASTSGVLGEDDQSEEEKEEQEEEKHEDEDANESAKQAEESQKESAKQAEEQQKEAAKTTTSDEKPRKPSSYSTTQVKSKTETISPSGFKTKTESEGNKQETEIETADGQKIKTKVEDDGTTKIEVSNGTIELKYSIENSQILLKAENENGEEIEIEDEELKELEDAVEDELEDGGVKIAATNDNDLAFTKGQVAALTNFPLSINTETKELIVTTPAGQKVVAVLPDEAVANLLATGIISKVETLPADTETQGQLGALNGVVKLEIRNGEVVYKVNGVKTHRVLGLIPVTTSVAAFVSTETGTTIAKQQSILSSFVDFLSP